MLKRLLLLAFLAGCGEGLVSEPTPAPTQNQQDLTFSCTTRCSQDYQECTADDPDAIDLCLCKNARTECLHGCGVQTGPLLSCVQSFDSMDNDPTP